MNAPDTAHHVDLPAFAEPHAHLDKAFLAELIPNPTGDLMGAIQAMDAHQHLITHDDTVARAVRAARLLHANGCTAIRTHADTIARNPDPLGSVRALIEVRERLRDLVEIQVVALCGWPTNGAAGAEQRAALRDAIAIGVDAVGGCPHLEDDPVAANDFFLTIAAEAGLPLDLHTDETLDPRIFALDDLSTRVVATGFPHAVTASHCVSLGVQPAEVQQRVAEQVAAAGISVVVLPHTNLFLQGRDHTSPMPRGLTAVKALRAAGVTVAAGGDNLQDPFNPVGRGDPLETAGLMIMAAHLLPDEAVACVSTAARSAMGLPPSQDLVRVASATVREAIALAPMGRTISRISSHR
ncbi:MAG: amidohydrolase family protein [Ilumatobacteraceae bacterium]